MAKKKKSSNAKTKKATVKTTSVSRTVKTSKKITFPSLNQWNLGLTALHAMQGIIVLILAKASTLPITTHYLTVDTLATKSTGQPVLAQAVRHLFDINLAYIVIAFFLMSAVAHLIIATSYRKQYEADLQRGINKARWIEYSISASTMMVGIALLSGVYDISTLITIFALILVMNLMGLAMEIHNQTTKRTNWLSYRVGVIAGIIPWLVIAMYLKGAVAYGSGVPTFVYWIYGSMFVLFSSFAFNMYLQYRRKGKWADYLYGERVYMILSLVAKSTLAWQVFAGTLRP